MESAEYDLIVIGAGPVGENVADRAVQGGLTVAIVESELVGGECSYWACMPSKVLLRAGAARADAADAPGALAAAPSGPVDVAAVLRRRDEIVHDWNDSGQVEWLDGAGIALVRGHGRLSAPRRSRCARRGRMPSCCAPGTPSPSAPDRRRCCRTSPGSPIAHRGPRAKRRAHIGCPTLSSFSAAESWRARWRPRTPPSAATSPCSPVPAFWGGWSRSPAKRWRQPCARRTSRCAPAPRSRRYRGMPRPARSR